MWRALALSGALVYGPFVAMAAYMLFFVPCPHCTSTAWWLMPAAPGVIPVEVAFQMLGMPRPAGTIAISSAMAVSFALVLLPLIIRRRCGKATSVLTGVVQIITSSVLALILMALIRA